MTAITQNNQKALYSLWSLNNNSRNLTVGSEKKNINNNNIGDSNKTNNNINKIMIITIIVVMITITMIIIINNNNKNNNNHNHNQNVSKNQFICLEKCFSRLCFKVFELSDFFNVSGI